MFTLLFPAKKKIDIKMAIDMVGSLSTLSTYGDDGIFEETEDLRS